MTSPSDIAEARKALAGAGLQNLDPDGARFERLGGLTNRVFKVTCRNGNFCLRLPGGGTEAYIDRCAEQANARAAFDAGVAPEVLYFGSDGVMVTPFIDGAVTMTGASFRDRPDAVERAGLALRQLHDMSRPFATRFDAFVAIESYLKVLMGLAARLVPGYLDVLADAAPIRDGLAAHSFDVRACHCDPLCENFLDASDRMWLVDWEYSGNCDPMWDLGDLSLEGNFDAAMDLALMQAYLGRAPRAIETGRMAAYKVLSGLYWAAWAMIQHANKNPADDFWAYSVRYLERSKQLMRSPEFSVHLTAISKGP